MRRFFASLFVTAGVVGILGVAPAAMADDLVTFDADGSVGEPSGEPGGALICVNPHIEVFGNVLLEDPICLP